MTNQDKFNKICNVIEAELDNGYSKFVIYPFGQNGIIVNDLLTKRYGLNDIILVDNKLCNYRTDVLNLNDIQKVDLEQRCILVTIENPLIYDEVYGVFLEKVKAKHYISIFPKKKLEKKEIRNKRTNIGKYSGGGPITEVDNPFIKSIGAFTSIAEGVAVVPNHPTNYISTHTFLYGTNRDGEKECEEPFTYDMFRDYRWYFPGVEPRGACPSKRITIGSDVWLGRNVIITNYANIGDGVIAGAGSIITKDVPDYAIVVGVPARVIKYRFSKEQIVALKKIAWWDWDDEKIISCYNDFFLPVDQFIKKHL